MTIRVLSADEYPAVLDLWRRAGLGTIRPEGRDSPAAFARTLETGAGTALGVEEDGALVGVVLATHDGRKGWINRLAVDPAARRRGIGTALLEAAEASLRERGLTVIAALVVEGNDPSLDLFAKAGYSLWRQVLYLSKRDTDGA
jgi:ribosomal protein S18 acetylase RimI-like enzyme